MKHNWTKNIFQIKSTLLGLMLIGVSIYIILTAESFNHYFIGGMLSAGTLMLFVPDRFINSLEKLIFGKEIPLKKDE